MSRPTPRLNFFKSQCRDWDRDWIYIVSMSRLRPRLKVSESQCRDRDRDWICKVSMSRLRPRLNSQKSQYRDWDRDWIYKSLNVETETEFTKVSMSRLRPRLNLQKSQCRDWLQLNLRLALLSLASATHQTPPNPMKVYLALQIQSIKNCVDFNSTWTPSQTWAWHNSSSSLF